MSCLDKLNRREELISRTLEIDEELYYKLEYLSKERYDASISKLINLSVEELIKTEDINVYISKYCNKKCVD